MAKCGLRDCNQQAIAAFEEIEIHRLLDGTTKTTPLGVYRFCKFHEANIRPFTQGKEGRWLTSEEIDKPEFL